MPQGADWIPGPGRLLRHTSVLAYEQTAEIEGQLDFSVTLYGPSGEIFDVTDRLIDKSIGRLTESTEEDFLELSHGDMSLTLDNADGGMDQFFLNVTPQSAFSVLVSRKKSGLKTGLLWEPLFGGVLDLPWSLSYDRRGKTCRLQVFSYSKLMERTSAEPVRRTFTVGVTASTSVGAVLVTTSANGTAALVPGDQITITNNLTSESRVVLLVLTTTTLNVTATWGTAFASALLTVDTPYYRDRGIAFLAGALATQAGVTLGVVTLRSDVNSYLATPMNSEGYRAAIPANGEPNCFLIRAGKISGNIGAAVDPRAAWLNQSYPDTFAKIDWTPIRDTEPALVYDCPAAPDYGQAAVDYATNDIWDYRPVSNIMRLMKNSVQVGPNSITLGTNFEFALDFAPEAGFPWFTYVRATSGGTKDGKVQRWDGAAFQDVDATHGGYIQYLRRLKLIAFHEFDPGTTGTGGTTILKTTNLHLYDPATATKISTVQVPSGLLVYTMRTFDAKRKFIACLYASGKTTRIKIWTSDWIEVADLSVADKASVYPKDRNTTAGIDLFAAYLTVFTEGPEELVCGAAAFKTFVIGRGYEGVVPYADFEGLSCGGSMKDLALISGCNLEADNNAIVTLTNRLVADPIRKLNAVTLGTPISEIEAPLWEYYRTSADVSGQAEDGTEIHFIGGVTGDSQHRLNLSSALISTNGIAETVGQFYSKLLSQRLKQLDIEVPETGELAHVLGYVRHRGGLYLIVELSLDADRRIYSLRLVEQP